MLIKKYLSLMLLGLALATSGNVVAREVSTFLPACSDEMAVKSLYMTFKGQLLPKHLPQDKINDLNLELIDIQMLGFDDYAGVKICQGFLVLHSPDSEKKRGFQVMYRLDKNDSQTKLTILRYPPTPYKTILD